MPEVLNFSIDGAARGNPGPAGIGVVISDAKGKGVDEIAVYIGETTNNIAEYSALLCALLEAVSRQAKKITVSTDSELLAKQINGEYRVKDPVLKVLHALCKHAIERLDACTVRHVPREKNRAADKMANRAVDAGLKGPSSSKHRFSKPPISQQTFPFGSS